MSWPVNHRHEADRATTLGVTGLISDSLPLLGGAAAPTRDGGRCAARRARARVRNEMASASMPTVRSISVTPTCMPTPKVTTLAAEAVLRRT